MSDEKQRATETICSSCGKTNLAGMRFCGFCGNPLTRPEATSVPVAETKPVAPPQSSVPPPSIAPKTAPKAPTVAPPASVGPRATTPPVRPGANAEERERERLISQATAFRVKGRITDARETLQQAVALGDGASPQTLAPLYEQIGDLLLIEEMRTDAIAAFARAKELDPKRVSAEKKFAEAALRKATISDALLRGDSVADMLASGELGGNRGKRNAGAAMLLSIMMPGFGQLYNGQMVKGIILIGVFMFSLLILSFSPETKNLFSDIAAIFALRGSKASHPISPLVLLFGLLCVGTWLYAIVDAPFNTGKSYDNAKDTPRVDKSGWEV